MNPPKKAPPKIFTHALISEGGGVEWFETLGIAKARALMHAENGTSAIVLHVIGEAKPAKAAYTLTDSVVE